MDVTFILEIIQNPEKYPLFCDIYRLTISKSTIKLICENHHNYCRIYPKQLGSSTYFAVEIQSLSVARQAALCVKGV